MIKFNIHKEEKKEVDYLLDDFELDCFLKVEYGILVLTIFHKQRGYITSGQEQLVNQQIQGLS